jgi:hypothetical protein
MEKENDSFKIHNSFKAWIKLSLTERIQSARKPSRSQVPLMRIAQIPGSNLRPKRGVILLMVLLLIMSLGTLRAQEQDGPVEVSAATVDVTGDSVVVDLAMSRPASVRSFTLTNPDRLVFDIENSLLALEPDTATIWSSPIRGVERLEISQFSIEPPVVRIVAEVTDSALDCDRMNTENGLRLAVFRGTNPLVEAGPGPAPESLIPTIESFWHETTPDGGDKFVIDFSFGVVLPQIRIESPTVLLLRFPGTDIILPASHPTNYSASVDGNLVERMRAELLMGTEAVSTEIRLTVGDTSVLGYTLQTESEDTLELIVFQEHPATPAPAPIEEPPAPAPAPIATEGGQVMVLSSTDTVPTPTDAQVQIDRVQFQTIDTNTDRFYIFYEGGDIEPRVQRFNYPTRITFFIPDAAVVLPAESEGRFQTSVNGTIADELKVFNRVIEGVGPECQLVFYFPALVQENIGYSMDYVSEGELHIDFYRTSTPVDIETPVEVNLSIGEEVPAPPVVEEPAPPVVEETQPEVVEQPVPEIVEEPAPAVVEEPSPEPVEPPVAAGLPMINVVGGEVIDGNIVFHIVTSQQLPIPEIVEYHYPDRIGLRFPLSDVQLLDAGEAVYTSYTHIRAIPLVRAIIKDREDEKYTTLTFALEGKYEEYQTELNWNGNELSVTFHYTPAPVAVEEEVPELIQPAVPEPVEEPVVETPAPEQPAVVPAPEPAPEVVEEPAPEVVEPAPEETEQPAPPAAPGNPPFGMPAPLPVIAVALESAEGNVVSFRITTSEPMPEPQWVQYRYPDRLGLRFPLSDVELLDADPGVNSAYTHVPEIPLVRTISKDRDDERSTTVAFTLDGSLEEYTSTMEQQGNEILVAFRYIPTPEEIEVVEQPVPAPPIEAQPAVETPVVAEPAPAVEVETVEPVVEEPVLIAEVAEEEVKPPEEEISAEPEVEIQAEPVPEPVPVVVEEAQPAVEEAQPAVEEEYEAVEVSSEAGESNEQWAESFGGVVISEITFGHEGNADVLVLATDGRLEDWEIMPVNFPTKLLIRLPNSRPIMPDGDPQRYDQQVSGQFVDQYTVTATSMFETPFTILSLYARGLESTDAFAYDVFSDEQEWKVAVFPRGEASPFGYMQAVQPEPAAGESVVPEPVSVTGEGIEENVEVTTTEENVPKITMRLDNADIRDVIQLIATQAGLNIAINPEVQGTITISLTDIPLFDLLDLLGAQMGFTYIVQHGVYVFGDPDRLEEQFIYWDRWYVRLSYSVPDQVKRVITGLGILGNDQIQIYQGTRSLATGNLTPAESMLVLTGEPRDLERAYKIIAAIDQPPVMVQVDFKILSTSLTDNSNMGFELNIGTGANTGMTALTFIEKTGLNPDMGILPQGFYRPGVSANLWTITYTINYLIEQGYAELLNSSSLTVANGQQGLLRVGETIPYRSTYQVSDLGRVTQRVDQQQLGLVLRFTARANPDDSVTLTLTPENRNLLELTDVGPRTVDESFSTTIRIEDGEPFIIGGFIRDEEHVNYDRFPLLSDLPLLGNLFRSREIQKIKSELIFVLTPYIIRPPEVLPEVMTDEDFGLPSNIAERQY